MQKKLHQAELDLIATKKLVADKDHQLKNTRKELDQAKAERFCSNLIELEAVDFVTENAEVNATVNSEAQSWFDILMLADDQATTALVEDQNTADETPKATDEIPEATDGIPEATDEMKEGTDEMKEGTGTNENSDPFQWTPTD